MNNLFEFIFNILIIPPSYHFEKNANEWGEQWKLEERERWYTTAHKDKIHINNDKVIKIDVNLKLNGAAQE